MNSWHGNAFRATRMYMYSNVALYVTPIINPVSRDPYPLLCRTSRTFHFHFEEKCVGEHIRYSLLYQPFHSLKMSVKLSQTFSICLFLCTSRMSERNFRKCMDLFTCGKVWSKPLVQTVLCGCTIETGETTWRLTDESAKNKAVKKKCSSYSSLEQ